MRGNDTAKSPKKFSYKLNIRYMYIPLAMGPVYMLKASRTNLAQTEFWAKPQLSSNILSIPSHRSRQNVAIYPSFYLDKTELIAVASVHSQSSLN